MNILILDNGQPFNLETPYVKETVDVPQQRGRLLIHNINRWPDLYNNANLVIFNRCIIPEIIFSDDGIPKIYYSHDAYDQLHILSAITSPFIYNRLIKIICVSEWQKQTFIKYLGLPENKLDVIGNSIDIFLYSGYVERNENKLVFASIPYKGLTVLPDLFNDICIRSKRNNLELEVYSSMSLYGNHDDSQYERAFNKLSKLKGVSIYKPVPMNELATVLMRSNLYIHPATYHETFGMVFTMAQAAGCLPVTTRLGAAEEIINNNVDGFLTKGSNIFNYSCYNEFIDLVVELLSMDLYKYRLNAIESSKKWFYINTAKRLLKCLNFI